MSARGNAGVLGACLLALGEDIESLDARAGAFVLAETIQMIRSAISGKK